MSWLYFGVPGLAVSTGIEHSQPCGGDKLDRSRVGQITSGIEGFSDLSPTSFVGAQSATHP